MVLILFVEVLKKVLKSLKFELKNPAENLINQQILKKIMGYTKIWSSTAVFNIDNNMKCFLRISAY